MKAVILAGGFGTRISEESVIKPKPMIEVGAQPILWHIMKTYSYYGINDFIICCGYKGFMIKEYFANYALSMSDVTFDLANSKIEIHRNEAESWKVTCVDTGIESMTGGRLRQVSRLLDGETFCMTYGDGVSDVDISKLVEFHKEQGRLATLTAVQVPGRFGAFTLGQDQSQISSFYEKPKGDGAWINGGYFVLEPEVIEYIESNLTVWEHGPLEKLAREGQLNAFKHAGFWQPMDTLRDKHVLEELWASNDPPWKVWS
ncbi:MAG: glucose-1-phosphate cytidylyltransferase [Opitutales bacterium]|nr:glucose-1-phosphate cytidylyltransferase [Opitutales bacterium]